MGLAQGHKQRSGDKPALPQLVDLLSRARLDSTLSAFFQTAGYIKRYQMADGQEFLEMPQEARTP